MKIAIVTGASSGMGRDFVRALDLRGFDEIWAIARSRDALEALDAECRTKVRVMPLDLKTDEAFDALSAALAGAKPDVRWLVCGAGYGRFGDYTKVDIAESLGMIDLNVTALVRTTYAALPYMSAGARIVEIASASAFLPLPSLNVYAATKAFVRHFSLALGEELRPRGITVTALCPGWVDTNFIATADKTDKTSVTSFAGMKKSPDVVAAALRAADRGNRLCVPGAPIKAARLGSKLLPVGFCMRMWNAVRK